MYKFIFAGYSALEMNVLLITTVIQYMKMAKVDDFERLRIFGQWSGQENQKRTRCLKQL